MRSYNFSSGKQFPILSQRTTKTISQRKRGNHKGAGIWGKVTIDQLNTTDDHKFADPLFYSQSHLQWDERLQKFHDIGTCPNKSKQDFLGIRTKLQEFCILFYIFLYIIGSEPKRFCWEKGLFLLFSLSLLLIFTSLVWLNVFSQGEHNETL